MNRRGFLSAILAASVAPYVARASSLMHVRQLDISSTVAEALADASIKQRIAAEELLNASAQLVRIGEIVVLDGVRHLVTAISTFPHERFFDFSTVALTGEADARFGGQHQRLSHEVRVRVTGRSDAPRRRANEDALELSVRGIVGDG